MKHFRLYLPDGRKVKPIGWLALLAALVCEGIFLWLLARFYPQGLPKDLVIWFKPMAVIVGLLGFGLAVLVFRLLKITWIEAADDKKDKIG